MLANELEGSLGGLKGGVEWWLDLTFSGQKYRGQYTARRRALRIAIEEARSATTTKRRNPHQYHTIPTRAGRSAECWRSISRMAGHWDGGSVDGRSLDGGLQWGGVGFFHLYACVFYIIFSYFVFLLLYTLAGSLGDKVDTSLPRLLTNLYTI